MFNDVTLKRFWDKVERRGLDDCWEWLASKRQSGYGVFRMNYRNLSAHRVAAMIVGMDIDGLDVRHSCDNPSCVNPAHLSAGTTTDNIRDMWSRNRQGGVSAINAAKTHCKRGHPLSGVNLYINPQKRRICRTCVINRYKRIRHELGKICNLPDNRYL